MHKMLRHTPFFSLDGRPLRRAKPYASITLKQLPQRDVGNCDNASQIGDAVDNQLQAMSESLLFMLGRLEEQREKCTSKAERKHLDRLLKEARKQAAAITKFQDSVEDTVTIMARSSQALENPIVEKLASHRNSRVLGGDVHDMLFQAVVGPFQKQRRLVRKHRPADSSRSLKIWRTKGPVARQATITTHKDEQPSRPATAPASVPDASSITITITSTASDSDVSPKISGEQASHSEPSSPDPQPEAASDTEAESAPILCATPILSAPSEVYELDSSSSCYSTPSSPRFSAQDWDSLSTPTPPLDGLLQGTMAPPLPRKSSRRRSFTPRVPSPKCVSFMSRLPPKPVTPPPSPPMVQVATREKRASQIVETLEKRYSLTILTPPSTP